MSPHRSGWRIAALGGASLLLARCGGSAAPVQGDAVELVFTSTPAIVLTQQPFSVAVQARDGSGHGTGTLHQGHVEVQLGLGSSPPGGAVGGTARATADADGNAILQGLTLHVLGQYTLTASVPAVAAIAPVTSPSLTVVKPPIPGADAGP